MFDRILGLFSRDIGIDLGTANTLVHVKDRGIVIDFDDAFNDTLSQRAQKRLTLYRKKGWQIQRLSSGALVAP